MSRMLLLHFGDKIMALPSRYGIDKKINSMEGLSAYENGGKGSGNFGHSGRPGQVGGSGDGTGETIDEKIKRAEEYAEISADRSASWVEEADKEAARDLGLEPDTMAPTKGEFWREAKAMLEAKKDEADDKKDASFHSRYEGGSAPIQYDGDTFYPDKDGRGMTTKDGKRTMMFPDEVLHARQQMVDNWKKEGLTKTSYEHAKELYFKTKKDSTITDQDPRDKKHATRLAGELGAVIRRYEDEHPEVFLK